MPLEFEGQTIAEGGFAKTEFQLPDNRTVKLTYHGNRYQVRAGRKDYNITPLNNNRSGKSDGWVRFEVGVIANVPSIGPANVYLGSGEGWIFEGEKVTLGDTGLEIEGLTGRRTDSLKERLVKRIKRK